jgi:plastocyanin
MSLLPRARLRGAAAMIGLSAIGLAACGAGTPNHSTATPAAAPAAAPASSQAMPGMAMPSTTLPSTTLPSTTTAPSAAAVSTNAVTIQKFAFGPSTVTVKAGSTITWTNMDDEAHTVFFTFDGSRSPILVNTANVYHKTFTTPGTYTYHCTIHPFMTGTVVVTA